MLSAHGGLDQSAPCSVARRRVPDLMHGSMLRLWLLGFVFGDLAAEVR
jgi:hypothetical protein